MLLVCGMPLMFFELCLGQFGREGPITVWKICPLFQGQSSKLIVTLQLNYIIIVYDKILKSIHSLQTAGYKIRVQCPQNVQCSF